MDCKRVLAVILSVVAVVSLSACKEKEEASSVIQESTTGFNNVINETVAESVSNTEAVVFNTTSEYYIQETSQASLPVESNASTEIFAENTSAITEIETNTETETIVVATTSEAYDDPCEWATERIVEEYKKAAKESYSTAISTQSITLKEININNGEHDNAISFIKPIIAKFIESNSSEKEGITGGFDSLVPQDVASAKAYKNGNDTVIEMLMVEQTSGAKEDAFSGSVGHAITTVGDISEVVKDLENMGLPLELSEEDTKIYYTNPSVKVVIDNNGKIISGTWSYTVEISMNNFKAFGKNVDKASIVMENTITV